MRRILLSLVLPLLFFTNSFADSNIAVTSWRENSYINSSGKNSEITIKAKIQNLPENYTLNSFTFGFGTKNAIQIKSVTNDSKIVKSDFSGNNLKINFSQPKRNGDSFNIYISYSEKYQKINKFLRAEAILIPAFAAGANARVSISYPGYMESATLNLNVLKNGNSFIYQGRVPADGITEIIKLTPSRSVWNVTSKVKLRSNKALQGVSVELPDYFFHPRQKVKDRTLLASTIPESYPKEKGKYILKFASDTKEILIEHRAKISTGKNVRKSAELRASDHLKYDSSNRELLFNNLQRIKRDPRYSGLPLYAKIGGFTHDLIKYDRRYIGRTPAVKEILRNPTGVCTEYANLFNSLARAAGIPSLIINGMACGEAEKCEGHAWNLIYYKNRWIEVDPTWNLMSGVVSSSHVYFSDNDKQAVGTSYPGDGRIVELEVDMGMSILE
jgi:hypothetical protein